LNGEALFLRTSWRSARKAVLNSASSPPPALRLGVVASPLQLEDVDDSGAGDPNRLTSQGLQAVFDDESRGWEERGFRKIFAT
jgi:hypothetical protein